MMHMLTSFDLKPPATLAGFQAALDAFSAEMQARSLVLETGAVCQRVRHPVMDTDERTWQYCFTMSFEDRAQCDRAVAWIYDAGAADEPLHVEMYAQITNAVFTCWADPAEE